MQTEKPIVVAKEPFVSPPKKPFRLSKEGAFICLCLLPAVLFVGIFTYYPLLRGIIMSFQNYTLFNLLDVRFIGLDNFFAVLTSPEFPRVALNSFYWVAVSLFFQLLFGFALALFMRRRFRGRGIYQAFVFFPWAMSGFLIGLIWRWMFNAQFGVINDLLVKSGLIAAPIPFLADGKWALAAVIIANIWYGVAFFAIMILAALQSIPEELYEAAAMDGAGRIQQFWSVTLPYILPTMLVTILLRVIWILNFPDIIYAMTNGGPAGSTHIFATYMIDKVIFGQDYGQASAVGVIIVLLLLVFTVFYVKATRMEKGGDF
ncbi:MULTISPECIES: carbohydrate ABC transporter permease [Brevibacillus]|uniref:carbohydrate ABC transporter permease n=1 Tax=Brevibacillus TaxID=55080 RepID=UPI00156B90B2|nr:MULTISPECIES: sugar ABC transporter permease [Brevibacillus]MBU8712967.1 ABC transporter permease subunit [Brevibacillus parabrevis]MED2256424.1 sugar ABC transporter permease [Brevibacillus parabrevis]NRQ52995.1 sugar ABC transporter permease [Brevibacillus sp. HD1.4A]UED70545.1 sugar ABC transporter permease [Brevibacillus sp. HD3.3A]WDV96839.1 sugar ABC transporter permease [Brevibacillus parabrevis]